jgi:TolB-like protein
MSPDKENEYVCAGITEDIITDLSRIKGLNVMSKTDVLPFRYQEINTRQLGETLGVDYVLDGSVRKAGKKLRITAQLTDVKTGFHIWADRFDRLVEDIFEVQNEVANNVARALKISLTDNERESLAQKPTEDVRAYDFYMRARQFLSQRGRRKTEAAIQMLDNALAIDPDFALAYTGLAESYSAMYSYYDGDEAWLAKIIEVNEKALELGADLIESQFSLGLVYFHKKEFDKAKRTFEDVVGRRAYYYDAWYWLGVICDIKGEYDAALEHYELCAAIKPYSLEPWLYMNMTHRRKGDVEAAKMSATRFLEIGLRKLELNPDDTVTLSRFAVIYTLFGERDKAYGALARILESSPDDGLVLYNCASTYALLEDKGHALSCLRMALESGFKNIREWVKNDPDFDELRETEEFKALLAEYGGA